MEFLQPGYTAALGCTDRHLRRVFEEEYGITPVQYLQTCRLLMAKSLLTETSLPILDIVMAAGFGSVRQFNNIFKQRYKMTPLELRKNTRVKRALDFQNAGMLKQIAEEWRPWRSYATVCLWNSLQG